MSTQVIAIGLALCFMALDVLLGVINAAAHNELDSSRMREGLMHKGGEIALLAVGALLQYASSAIELGFDVPLVEGVAVPLILMEVFSVLEIIKRMNPELSELPIFKSLNSK